MTERVEFNCPECMCAFSACECPGDSVRIPMFIGRVCTALLALLTSCSPCPCDTPKDAATPVVRAPLPPLEPDPQSLELGDPKPPCSRVTVTPIVWDGGSTEWVIPLPCKPYDRFRDDPRPGPDAVQH